MILKKDSRTVTSHSLGTFRVEFLPCIKRRCVALLYPISKCQPVWNFYIQYPVQFLIRPRTLPPPPRFAGYAYCNMKYVKSWLLLSAIHNHTSHSAVSSEVSLPGTRHTSVIEEKVSRDQLVNGWARTTLSLPRINARLVLLFTQGQGKCA